MKGWHYKKRRIGAAEAKGAFGTPHRANPKRRKPWMPNKYLWMEAKRPEDSSITSQAYQLLGKLNILMPELTVHTTGWKGTTRVCPLKELAGKSPKMLHWDVLSYAVSSINKEILRLPESGGRSHLEAVMSTLAEELGRRLKPEPAKNSDDDLDILVVHLGRTFNEEGLPEERRSRIAGMLGAFAKEWQHRHQERPDG